MDQDIVRRASDNAADVARNGEGQHPPVADDVEPAADGHAEQQPADGDHKRDARLTRRVHVVLGVVIAVLGAWLLYMSRTELAFRGPNHEPGPGYLPVLLTLGLIGPGLALSAVWLWGPKVRSGEAPTLSLQPRHIARALLVWLAPGVCGPLVEPPRFPLFRGKLVPLVIRLIEKNPAIPPIIPPL